MDSPLTPTYDSREGENYKRGVENYRKDSRMHSSRGRSMSPDVKRARSRTRSRSPLKRTYDNKSRDGRSRGSARQVRDKESRVYVSNMNYDMKWMELKDIMKKIGNVEHVEVFTDNEGRSKGCAVVEFTYSKDAQKAIKELDGSEMKGRKVKVREDIMDDSTYKEQLKTQKDKSRNLKDNPSSNSGSNNLLGGANLFGGLGAGLGGGLAAGLGAGLGGGLGGLGGGLGGLGGINNLLGAQVGAQQTSYLQLLSMLNSKGGEPINSTVFVSNLDYEVNWQKLKDIMRRAGNCLRCDILQDDKNRSKGYGTVVFETPMEALTSVALYNGFEIGKSRRQMSVRLDRSSPVHQILAQLGVSSTDITQATIQQLQQIATLVVLSATSGGAGAGLGGAGLAGTGLGGAGVGVSGVGAMGGLGLGAISALTGTAGSNYGAQATTQGAALGQLGGTLGTGLGLNQQLQGLGGLLQTQGSTGSTALTGGVTNSTSALLGRGSSYGVDSTSSAQSSYGLQNLSSFGITAGSTTSRLSDGVSRGYTPSSGSNNTSSSGTRVFVRNLPFSFTWQALKDKFRDAGKVIRADIKTDEKNRSKGCGTVTFENSSDVTRAIALFNGSRVEGREIEVRVDRM